ncbi:MAG: glycosyltransferase [Paramuribaculum sp.]|nr:glycosyltransferase [Paramuribaculum sp.]
MFHNAEQTIERTLKSLALQELDGVEYIFVDDGSRDRSVEILRDFMALNPNLSGRHRLVSVDSRRGSAHATSVGFSVARGEYVIRCDADDYFAPEALRKLWDASGHGMADIVSAPYLRLNGKRVKEVRYCDCFTDLNDMPLDTLHFSLCNKLLRRSMIIENDLLPFEGVDCWEDVGVVSRLFALMPSVVFMSELVYNYVWRKGSLTDSACERILHEHLMMALLLEQWFVNHNLAERYEEFLTRLKFIAKVKFMRGRYKNVADWKRTFPEVNHKIMGIRGVGFFWRVLFSIVTWLPTSVTQKIADVTSRVYRK